MVRMVTFKDSRMPKYDNDLAIKTEDGTIFKQKESSGSYSNWLDASNPKSWEYVTSIVKEAVDLGFDEIQFDYIRFPETTLYEYVLFDDTKERHEYIEGFLKYVRQHVPNSVLSADVFGMPLISKRDYGNIGQTLESIGWDVEYIYPMVYPSHYANDSKGVMGNGVGQSINGVKFTKPDLDPYGIVYNTLTVGKNRIDAIDGYKLKVRPYIQGFTARYLLEGYYQEYGAEQYRQQIQAVYDAGYDSWIFWNSRNDYAFDAFLKNEDK